MELRTVLNTNGQSGAHLQRQQPNSTKFIEANTEPMAFEELKEEIIPNFSKDNESTISQVSFIDVAREAVISYFGDQDLLPAIRVSHPVYGRVPSAKDKPAIELLDSEKTRFFERMMFVMELNNIHQMINGQLCKLVVGGIKNYHLDNLNSSKGADEHFSFFVGFQVKVCLNMCIWTDGYSLQLKAHNEDELYMLIKQVIQRYDAVSHISELERFTGLELSEKQFAQLIGRCKLYQYLPVADKKELPYMGFTDYQISKVAGQFYQDESFSRDSVGRISLWSLLNLFTGANKSSYIDGFLHRGANAHMLVNQIAGALDGTVPSWFLS